MLSKTKGSERQSQGKGWWASAASLLCDEEGHLPFRVQGHVLGAFDAAKLRGRNDLDFVLEAFRVDRNAAPRAVVAHGNLFGERARVEEKASGVAAGRAPSFERQRGDEGPRRLRRAP